MMEWKDKDPEERTEELRQDLVNRIELDEKADIHQRLSTLESALIRTNRRITKLEDGSRGAYSDDPLSHIFSPGLVWAMVLLTLAPLIVEMIKQWRSES
jgi:hypothetical protein